MFLKKLSYWSEEVLNSRKNLFGEQFYQTRVRVRVRVEYDSNEYDIQMKYDIVPGATTEFC